MEDSARGTELEEGPSLAFDHEDFHDRALELQGNRPQTDHELTDASDVGSDDAFVKPSSNTGYTASEGSSDDAGLHKGKSKRNKRMRRVRKKTKNLAAARSKREQSPSDSKPNSREDREAPSAKKQLFSSDSEHDDLIEVVDPLPGRVIHNEALSTSLPVGKSVGTLSEPTPEFKALLNLAMQQHQLASTA